MLYCRWFDIYRIIVRTKCCWLGVGKSRDGAELYFVWVLSYRYKTLTTDHASFMCLIPMLCHENNTEAIFPACQLVGNLFTGTYHPLNASFLAEMSAFVSVFLNITGMTRVLG